MRASLSRLRCLQYSKSTIFQANHNLMMATNTPPHVVCNTAKVRFFKQITTLYTLLMSVFMLFAIQQKYDFSSKSQLFRVWCRRGRVVCNTAKVRFFKQITTGFFTGKSFFELFAIQQKYDFSSKSQPAPVGALLPVCCLQYSKSTIFQANHNSRFL